MTEYEKMARRSRPRAARQQMAETQRQFVRGILFLIGVTLLIIFIFEAFLGASMYYLDIPRIIQPIHIILSAMAWFLIIDGLFKSWLMVRDFKS